MNIKQPLFGDVAVNQRLFYLLRYETDFINKAFLDFRRFIVMIVFVDQYGTVNGRTGYIRKKEFSYFTLKYGLCRMKCLDRSTIFDVQLNNRLVLV